MFSDGSRGFLKFELFLNVLGVLSRFQGFFEVLVVRPDICESPAFTERVEHVHLTIVGKIFGTWIRFCFGVLGNVYDYYHWNIFWSYGSTPSSIFGLFFGRRGE